MITYGYLPANLLQDFLVSLMRAKTTITADLIKIMCNVSTY